MGWVLDDIAVLNILRHDNSNTVARGLFLEGACWRKQKWTVQMSATQLREENLRPKEKEKKGHEDTTSPIAHNVTLPKL